MFGSCWLDFHSYLARHSEAAVLALLDDLQRREGISLREPLSLEDHWNLIMNYVPRIQQRATA